MQHCWLGETNFDYSFSETDLPKAIAIQINGNDHFIRDVIVFSSKIGLEVNGAADYISGVHVWFPNNQALCFADQHGVMAFHVTVGQNRFDGCYIDGSRAVFEGGGLSGNTWVNGFECCAGCGGAHGVELRGNSVGPGLTITHNLFRGGNVYSNATGPVSVKGTRIDSNSYTGDGRGTRVAAVLSQTNSATWQFDFCDRLVFPTISHVRSITVQAEPNAFPVATARAAVGCTLLVETSVAFTGTVTVEVDSSDLDNE